MKIFALCSEFTRFPIFQNPINALLDFQLEIIETTLAFWCVGYYSWDRDNRSNNIGE